MSGNDARVASALVLAAATLFCALPQAVRAQSDPIPSCEDRGVAWGIGPDLISAPDGRSVGLKGDLSACFTGHTQLAAADEEGLRDGFPASYALRLGIDAVWSLGSSATASLPRTSTIGATLGWSISLSKPDAIVDPDDIDAAFDVGEGGFNYGWLEVGVAADHEASADWAEQHVVGSAQLRYGLPREGWRRLAPTLLAHIDAVVPVASDIREAEDLDLDRHSRWGVRAYWDTGLDVVASALVDARLKADLALYRTSGLASELETLGWNEGEYVTITLSHERFVKLLGPVGIGSIYARYMDGRWPTIAQGARAFTAGATVRVGGE